MAYEDIPLDHLLVNPANDRHGELENETAAIAELFRLREAHMRRLAEDIREQGKVYDPPLVYQHENRFVVFDGNRRVTCLKLIAHPERAPSQDLQVFFRELRDNWDGDFPADITCQVEPDRDEIDSIIFRRHTGSQGGVGQSNWDDRAKHNFVERTGRGGRVDVAVRIEDFLKQLSRVVLQEEVGPLSVAGPRVSFPQMNLKSHGAQIKRAFEQFGTSYRR
ncbi:ParB N-terminal domain-containing protein [Qipengyuania sp.]|uniref:ParB N-terminal domain-containing protein n=1 Tax=Qipengyuania sp. TaxID=2004515 RepID=UPI003510D966